MASPMPSSSLPSPSLIASPSPLRALLPRPLPIPSTQIAPTFAMAAATSPHAAALLAALALIPLDEFDLSNQGVLELNITSIAFDPLPPGTSTSPSSACASSSTTRDRLPSLGFRPTWFSDSDPGCRLGSSGALRPGHLRLRGAQVQADHALRPLRATQGCGWPSVA